MAVEHRYFTEFTLQKGAFYLFVTLYVACVCVVVTLETFMDHSHCSLSENYNNNNNQTKHLEYPNVLYNDNPCLQQRIPFLLYLTPMECSFGRRLVCAVLLGGVVGWERRMADRPAGIRTMSLVSLGSCLFTINSAFAFLDGPMAWDASRISAAIPSGVGFLGAGLIFKEASLNKETQETTHIVHGLTTSASLWLSAAVGVACGGQLYFAASFGVALMLLLLRFGPRFSMVNDDDDDEGDDDKKDDGDAETSLRDESSLRSYGAAASTEEEKQGLLKRGESSSRLRDNVRKRPTLGDMV